MGFKRPDSINWRAERDCVPNLIFFTFLVIFFFLLADSVAPATMALSVSNLASSLSSLSFSSQVSQGQNIVSFTRANSVFPFPAKSARRASLSITATVASPAASEEVEDTMELKKYVKSRRQGKNIQSVT